MLTTRLDKAKEFIICLRPACVFVAVPWSMGKMAHEWCQGFRGDYSLVRMDLEGGGARDVIERHLENGPVMVYGTPPEDFIELDDMFDVEYALVWLYPNKQTTYFNHVRWMGLGCDRRLLPPGSEQIWSRITKCPNDQKEMKRKLNIAMTRTCYEYQKKLKNMYIKERDGRVLVVAV